MNASLFDLVDQLGPGKATGHIDVLDVAGNVAAVRVTMENFHGADYIDFHVLMKTDEGWKIAAKVYTEKKVAMDFLELAADRWSVRKYDQRPVEDDKIARILKAAQLAPTAVNYQPFKVYVLKSPEALAKIGTACRCIYGAPLVFMVCSDERQTWKSRTEPGYTCGEMDASIVCTHMMLEAWELGVGSCWVRLFSVEDVQRAFDLPPYMVPRCLLPAGYAASDAVPYAPWHDVYKPMGEISEVL